MGQVLVSEGEKQIDTDRAVWIALLPVVVLYAYVLLHWPDNLFVDDSYFYLQVGRNVARGLGSTFNGLMPTNGYHPLWMLCCAAVFRVVPDRIAAVRTIAGLIALLNLATLAGLTSLLHRAGTRLAFSAWLIYLPFSFTSQLGCEGALNAALLAAAVLAGYSFARQPRRTDAILLAGCLTLAVLCRLDDIFLAFTLFAGAALACPRAERGRAVRLLTAALPIPLVVWSAYLWSNRHWFGVWLPISGLLKSHTIAVPGDSAGLPHIAWFDLTVIAICLPPLWRFRRDRFFAAIEVPFAAGVLLHAAAILLVLSTETRWTWYYAPWTMLAAILLARTLSIPFARMSNRMYLGALAACVAILVAAWYPLSLKRFGYDLAEVDGGFRSNVQQRAGLHTLLAFDKPGLLAFYSEARIVPLDGLMGDLRFQQQLAAGGLQPFREADHVDGFVGPPLPLDRSGKRDFCDNLYLGFAQFHCEPAAEAERWTVDRVDVYSRLFHTHAGTIELPPGGIVWNSPGNVTVWRLPEHD